MEKLYNNIAGSTLRWGGWGTTLAGVAIALAIMIVQSLTVDIYIIQKYYDYSLEEIEILRQSIHLDGFATSLATVVTLFFCTGLMVGIIKRKKGTNVIDYLAIRKVEFISCAYWFLVFITIMLFMHLVSSYLGIRPEQGYVKSIYESTPSFWLLAFALIVAAPVFEELFFRGFLIGGWKDTILQPAGAVFLSAVCWSLIHTQYNVFIQLQILTLGLILGLARIKSRSVILPIGLHAFNNFVTLMYMIVFPSQTWM